MQLQVHACLHMRLRLCMAHAHVYRRLRAWPQVQLKATSAQASLAAMPRCNATSWCLEAATKTYVTCGRLHGCLCCQQACWPMSILDVHLCACGASTWTRCQTWCSALLVFLLCCVPECAFRHAQPPQMDCGSWCQPGRSASKPAHMVMSDGKYLHNIVISTCGLVPILLCTAPVQCCKHHELLI